MTDYLITKDDLSDGQVMSLLNQHYQDMISKSPIESVHALTEQEVKNSDVQFWSLTQNNIVLVCCGLKVIEPHHVELKSMKTHHEYTKQGLASRLLLHVMSAAKDDGINRVSLETGTQSSFEAAHHLYRKYGFKQTGPFSNYRDDPNSCFMTITL